MSRWQNQEQKGTTLDQHILCIRIVVTGWMDKFIYEKGIS